jgi:hypothetical protein
MRLRFWKRRDKVVEWPEPVIDAALRKPIGRPVLSCVQAIEDYRRQPRPAGAPQPDRGPAPEDPLMFVPGWVAAHDPLDDDVPPPVQYRDETFLIDQGTGELLTVVKTSAPLIEYRTALEETTRKVPTGAFPVEAVEIE